MIEQLIASFQKEAAPALQNLGLDQKQTAGSVNALFESLGSVVGKEEGGAGLAGLAGLAGGGLEGILSKVSGPLQNQLVQNLGLDAGKAGSVVTTLLPLLQKFLGNAGNNSDLQGLVGSLLGGKGGDLGGLVKGLGGKLFG